MNLQTGTFLLYKDNEQQEAYSLIQLIVEIFIIVYPQLIVDKIKVRCQLFK